jgi:hypothetical protein
MQYEAIDKPRHDDDQWRRVLVQLTIKKPGEPGFSIAKRIAANRRITLARP